MNVLETMKQALEALKSCDIVGRGYHYSQRFSEKDVEEAITNLRAAIAEMEAEVCSSCSSELNKCRITGTKHEPDEMIDIVERLRFHVPRDIGTDDLRKEAADEIDRLRNALAAAHAETDSVVYARDQAYEQLAAMKEGK